MKFEREGGLGRRLIRRCEPGHITIDQEVYDDSLIVTPERVIAGWGPARIEDLAAEHVAAIAQLRPEVVLIGTGARQRFPTHACLRPLVDARIGFEIMDTAAACRTYNILMSDGRRVAAALLMVER